MNTNTLREWFTNFGTVFSILGFFATIYLGIWYVPTWLQESQNERIKNAEREILQSVKELIYSDTTLTLNELPTLIHAKEITLQQSFPLSITDILTRTAESFMEDKFLPLSKRKDLINKIERIKFQLPKESKPIIKNQKTESKVIWWLDKLSMLLTILIVILGLISFFLKYKSNKDKDAEIQNELQDISLDKDNSEYGYEFEKNIESAIRNRSDLQIQNNNIRDNGVDVIFFKNDKQYYIEAKYLSKSKIGLKTFHKLANYLNEKKGEAWLVYNTDMTPLVVEQIQDFNKNNKEINIKPVKISNSKEFANKLDELLPK